MTDDDINRLWESASAGQYTFTDHLHAFAHALLAERDAEVGQLTAEIERLRKHLLEIDAALAQPKEPT